MFGGVDCSKRMSENLFAGSELTLTLYKLKVEKVCFSHF